MILNVKRFNIPYKYDTINQSQHNKPAYIRLRAVSVKFIYISFISGVLTSYNLRTFSFIRRECTTII